MNKKISLLLLLFLLVCPSGRIRPQDAGGSRALRYGNQTEAGISMGVGKFKTDVVNGVQIHAKNDEIIALVQTVNGVWYMDRLFIGAGVGAEFWQHGLFYPVFGRLSYTIQPKENTFVASVDLGGAIGNRYGTTYYNSGKGGFLATLGLGYQVKITKKLRFLYEVFLKYQVIKSTYRMETVTDTTAIYGKPIDYNVPNYFIGFRIGISY